MKKFWIWDLEVLPKVFTATFVDRNSDEKRVFVYTENINEISKLLEFLSTNVEGLIGYNSLYYDAQIIEWIIKHPKCKVEEIRQYSDEIINTENRKSDIPEWKLIHRHLDLFKALSLSTSAKRTGLKWCEYQMDFENIEDIPENGTLEQILSYNLNDVLATKALYKKYYHEIDLRNQLSQRENLSLLNCTEPDLAKKLFSKYLSKEMNISQQELRELGTTRNVVKVKDIIFPYIQFKTEKFQLVKKEFEKLELKEEDGFEFIVNKDINITYGLGGIHAAPNNRIVESNNEFIIKSLDVVSFYPNLMIRNNLCPAHLPKEVFLKLYEGFFEERKSIPKKDPRNYILKILLNATYGLTNDKYSFLKDREVTLAICINGQLLLTMLMEDILHQIPDSKLVMMNTDGFEVYIPRDFEEDYFKICKTWEQLTHLQLEFVNYQKMIISDVNNYISIFEDGKTKCKGKYEFENIPLHKNKSHSIIPRAVYNYWVNNISVHNTITSHKNIYDFCAGIKAKKSEKKGNCYFELHYLENNKLKKDKLSKTVRYYISNKGKYLMKCYENNDISFVEAPLKVKKFIKDWKITYFNKYEKKENYDIDYSYYTYYANKWINDIKNNDQLELFNYE